MKESRRLDRLMRRDGAYMVSLDGWRAIAILLVLLGHAMDDVAGLLQWLGLAFEPAGLKYIGMHGVQIFFGLSGFLITSKLVSDEQQHGRIELGAFYVRRSFRILPATLFFLGSVGVLALCGVLDITLGRWLATLLFSANYATADYTWYLGHFWSLAVEEHFYLLWPAAFLLLGLQRRRLAFALVLALVVAVWRAVDFKYQLSGTSAALFMGRTDIQVDHIIWGVVVALAYADPVWRPRLQAWLVRPWVYAALLSVLAALVLVHDIDWKLKFALYTVHGAVVPLAILSTWLNAHGWFTRWLETAPMRVIGRLSFSIYLWQQLFFVWADHRVPGLSPFQSMPWNVLAVSVCAVISFWLIEEPGIAWGRRLLKRWQGAKPGLPPTPMPFVTGVKSRP